MPADEYPPSFVQHRFRLPIESRVWITAVWTIAVWITAGQLLAAMCYCCVLQDAFAMCMYSMPFSNNMCLRMRGNSNAMAGRQCTVAACPSSQKSGSLRHVAEIIEPLEISQVRGDG